VNEDRKCGAVAQPLAYPTVRRGCYLHAGPAATDITIIMRRLLLLIACALAPTALCAQIIITEIMYDPVADRGTEYVELHNPTSARVQLRNWKIYDATGKAQATISRTTSIAPGEYLVIAADSLLFLQFPELIDSSTVRILGRASLGLNATGDMVVLRDDDGATVDSVAYLPAWHRPDLDDATGTSLERTSLSAASTDARTWSSSVARRGGSPAAPSSIALEPRVADAEIAVEPAIVSPDADGFQDVTRISYRLPMRTARVTIALYDRRGRLIDRIVNNEPSGPEGEVVWRGYDPNGMPLPPEVYVLLIEAYDPVGIALTRARTGIVVARR
jgi:hypothetical protein